MKFINRKNNKETFPEMSKKNMRIKEFFKNNKDLTIIYFSRMSHHILDGDLFDNFEGGKEWDADATKDQKLKEILVKQNFSSLDKDLRQKEILNNIYRNLEFIRNLGHNIIIVYPFPEIGFNVPKKLFRDRNKKNYPFIQLIMKYIKKETNY